MSIPGQTALSRPTGRGSHVRDTAISVPTPNGFAPVTKGMAALNQLLETFVAPDHVRFVTFIPEELLPVVQAGQIPPMPRTLSLQTNKKM